MGIARSLFYHLQFQVAITVIEITTNNRLLWLQVRVYIEQWYSVVEEKVIFIRQETEEVLKHIKRQQERQHEARGGGDEKDFRFNNSMMYASSDFITVLKSSHDLTVLMRVRPVNNLSILYRHSFK